MRLFGEITGRKRIGYQYFIPKTVCSLARVYLLTAAFIHLCLSVLYMSCQMKMLGVHSIISTIGYIVAAVIINNDRLRLIFSIVILEVEFFIILSVLVLGWDYNYQTYSFTIIALCILTSISNKKNRYDFIYPLVIFIATHIILFMLMIADLKNPVIPQYEMTERLHMIFKVQGVISYVFVTLAMFLALMTFIIDLNIAAGRIGNMQKDLIYISTHDQLTTLINRRSMNEYIDMAVKKTETENQTFSILLGDIDDFKKINDTYGHNIGDYVLAKVSKVIKNCVENSDSVCRWGGEEIMVLTQVDAKKAKELAEEIRKTIENTEFKAKEKDFRVTMTFGVAEYNKENSIKQLIADVDDKLYKGKQSTKNCVVV